METLSRRDLLALPNRLVVPREGELGAVLAARRLLKAQLRRRVAIASLAVGLGLFSTLELASAQAQNWQVTPIDFTPGKQSFNWLDLDYPLDNNFSALNQARAAYRGQGLTPTEVNVSWLMEQRRALLPGQSGWLGNCLAASVAAGYCPLIEGPVEAFGGVVMSWEDRMVGATLYHDNVKEELALGSAPSNGPYSKNVDEWGAINEANFARMVEVFEQKKAEGKVWVADTALIRGKPANEQWWVEIEEIRGQNLVGIDFTNWAGMGRGPQRIAYGPFPYLRAKRIALMDPSQPQPGQESNFYNLVDREVMAVYLGMATATPK
jgi:hypothetical protein